jgi:hypothetical protein
MPCRASNEDLDHVPAGGFAEALRLDVGTLHGPASSQKVPGGVNQANQEDARQPA